MQTEVLKELNSIARRNSGLLRPEDVVAFAADPQTALHSRFTWDDSVAAMQHRLWQARQIIRVTVTMLPRASKEFRAFVSLKSDRYQSGGGYRATAKVLSDPEQRESLLAEALECLEGWRERYRELKALAPVFEAIDIVARSEKPKKEMGIPVTSAARRT